MGTRFLVDTNTIIELLAGRLPTAAGDWLEEAGARGLLTYSIINRIEVLSWPAAETDHIRMVNDWLSISPELTLTNAVAAATINLRRSHRRKLPDAVVAATALIHDLTIITRNLSDFQAITGLRVINPHHPAALPAF